ncbi:MAG: PEP-CTERM sorting domain-containing protein [Dehalococcoidia bacterium]|nr:PEP-CTERM sorting domain-containing protein [Dehalococcoidia bacterium]
MCKKLFLLVLVLTVVGIVSVASAGTVAYWRFEPGEPGIDFSENAYPAMPDSDGRAVWRKGADDWSGNGNHLTTFQHAWAGENFSTDVPYATVPQTGASNAQSIVNAGSYPAAMTWSAQSLPSGTDIEVITPAAFTVEACFKASSLNNYSTLVGRDGRDVWTQNTGTEPNPGNWAPFYLTARSNGLVRIQFHDLSGYQHTAESALGLVTNGQWYCIAGVSDGSTLSLYLDDGGGYDLVAQTALDPNNIGIDTRLAIGAGAAGDNWAGTWTVGRGLWNGGHTDRFFGNIDEVRISDAALNPSQFLCVPEPATMVLLGLGSLALIRRRKS